MTIEIKSITLGMAATNSYLVADIQTKHAILIDPVAEAPRIKALADQHGWQIKLILATHAHFDHILASQALKELTNAPFWIHRDCVPMLENLPQQGKRFGFDQFPIAAKPDKLLNDAAEIITLDAIQLQALYSPGHAPGHLCFYMPDQKVVFSGDTLFYGSIGRTDLPGGDLDTLLKSIREQLLTLDDDVQVLPGHMRATSIGFERQHNPYL